MRGFCSLFLLAPLTALAAEPAAKAAAAPMAGSDIGGQLAQLLLGLLLVVGLIFALAWLLRRVQQIGPRGNQAIRLVASQMLGPRDRLLLVQVGGEQILLGISAGRITPLHVLKEPVPLADGEPAPPEFAQRLMELLGKENKDPPAMNAWRILLALVLAIAAPLAFGADDPLSIKAITLSTNAEGQQEYSVSLQILLIMTALSFIPAFVMLMTSFTRIIIVFSILRQALGLQQTPSNQILIGLALFLTLFIMAPVFDRINQDALQPYLNEQLPAQQAIARAEVPIKEFMLAQTRASDLELFVRLSKRTDIASPEQAPLTILIPAFVTSELKTAFQIGFMIFIPFLIIDMVVASILMAMGMMMLSPLIISLPFKIMLFVLIDGWALIMGTLAGSFGTL